MSDAANNAADPWIVQPPKQTAQVPVGFYQALFRGVSDITLPSDGSIKWRWEWEVQSGSEKGKIASALTDRSISPTTLPGVLIAGLLARPVQPGENVKAAIDSCKGRTFMVNVIAGPK